MDEQSKQLKLMVLNRLMNQNRSLPYQTNLTPEESFRFADWAASNNVPVDLSPKSDYDMSGYFKSLSGSPNPGSSISEIDNKPHFTDKFKTPFHQTFSNESQYSTGNDPHWEGNSLRDENGELKALELPTGILKTTKPKF